MPRSLSEALASVAPASPENFRTVAYLLAALALISFAVVVGKVGIASALRCRVHRVALVLLVPTLAAFCLSLFE